jgi:hypothetical protein
MGTAISPCCPTVHARRAGIFAREIPGLSARLAVRQPVILSAQ